MHSCRESVQHALSPLLGRLSVFIVFCNNKKTFVTSSTTKLNAIWLQVQPDIISLNGTWPVSLSLSLSLMSAYQPWLLAVSHYAQVGWSAVKTLFLKRFAREKQPSRTHPLAHTHSHKVKQSVVTEIMRLNWIVNGHTLRDVVESRENWIELCLIDRYSACKSGFTLLWPPILIQSSSTTHPSSPHSLCRSPFPSQSSLYSFDANQCSITCTHTAKESRIPICVDLNYSWLTVR